MIWVLNELVVNKSTTSDNLLNVNKMSGANLFNCRKKLCASLS